MFSRQIKIDYVKTDFKVDFTNGLSTLETLIVVDFLYYSSELKVDFSISCVQFYVDEL